MQVLAGIRKFQVFGDIALGSIFLVHGFRDEIAREADEVVEPAVREGLFFVDGRVKVGLLAANLTCLQSFTFSIPLEGNQLGP